MSEIIPSALSAEILIAGGWKVSQQNVRFYEKQGSKLLLRFYQFDNGGIVTKNRQEANYCNASGGKLEVEIYGPATEHGKDIEHYFRGEVTSVEEFETILREKETHVHNVRGKINGAKFGF